MKTHDIQCRMSDGLKAATNDQRKVYASNPLYTNFEYAEIMKFNIPDKELDISKSEDSIGLQIVDVYLWIINRFLNKKPLSTELKALASRFIDRSIVDGISMEGMAQRWNEFEKQLPSFEQLTDQHHHLNEQLVAKHRERVKGMNLD